VPGDESANPVPAQTQAGGAAAEGQVDAVLEVKVPSRWTGECSDGPVNFKQHIGLPVSDHLRGKDRRLTIREKFHK
jgi:hypothetical protein